MRASEVAAALLVEISAHGDGEMWDDSCWPITHISVVRGDDGYPIYNAESDEGCTCVDRRSL